METSDSEDYFESADEDFLSEEEFDEDVKPAVPLPKEELSTPESSENKSTKVALNEDIQDTGSDKVEKNDNNKQDTRQPPREGFAKAPRRVDCWFPDVNENKLDNEPKEISEDVINKSTKKEELAKTEKPLSTNNRIANIAQVSDNVVIKKGLELNVEEENVMEDDDWDNWNEEVVNKVTDTIDQENKESSAKVAHVETKILTANLKSVDIKKEAELKIEEQKEVEDDWNNWNDDKNEFINADIKPVEKKELQTKSEKVEENKQNDDGSASKVLDYSKSTTSEKESKAVCSNEDIDDLWGDDEDWGAIDKVQSKENIKEKVNAGVSKKNIVSKEIEEDDLWGDDEGWGVDSMPESNENTKKQVVSQINVNDDLWGDEDSWGVEDDNKVTSKKVDVEENIWNEISNPTKKGSLSDITKPLDNIAKNQNLGDNSWGAWGNWGKSVLSTAANLTNQVSQGLTTVIGIPDPEELAKQHRDERQYLESAGVDVGEASDDHSFGLSNFVSISKITKLVENTGTKVISGGLDTLETIGKKTMQVLQENDPGLKKKRAFLKIDQDRPVLSHILREAKEKAEEDNKVLEKPKQVNYELIFDDYQGLVHLEALEMLSRQCDIKVQSVISKTTDTELQETMDQIKELCDLQEIDDDDDSCDDIVELKSRIDAALEELNVPVNYKNLFKTLEENDTWICLINNEKINENEVHRKAIETLATITALIVEQFHKIGELLLVKNHRSTADEADSLVQLTTTLSGVIGTTSSKYSEILNNFAKQSSGKGTVNELITNVFFEAANSSRYIEDAFQLLIPVVQVGAI